MLDRVLVFGDFAPSNLVPSLASLAGGRRQADRSPIFARAWYRCVIVLESHGSLVMAILKFGSIPCTWYSVLPP